MQGKVGMAAHVNNATCTTCRHGLTATRFQKGQAQTKTSNLLELPQKVKTENKEIIQQRFCTKGYLQVIWKQPSESSIMWLHLTHWRHNFCFARSCNLASSGRIVGDNILN